MDNLYSTKSTEKIIMGTLIMYVSEYQLKRQRVYQEQATIANGFSLTYQGAQAFHLKVKGRIHKSQTNVPITLDTYAQTTNTFNFDISGIKYRNLKIVNYSICENTAQQYLECEIEFICTGNIEAVSE